MNAAATVFFPHFFLNQLLIDDARAKSGSSHANPATRRISTSLSRMHVHVGIVTGPPGPDRDPELASQSQQQLGKKIRRNPHAAEYLLECSSPPCSAVSQGIHPIERVTFLPSLFKAALELNY